MQFVDTHCHIHESEFFAPEDAEAALKNAVKSGVDNILCVGTSLKGSKEAISFSAKYPETCRASIGIHPHEGTKLTDDKIDSHLAELATLVTAPEVVAIGECGLDFYYNDRSQALAKQQKLLRGQLELARKYNLPVSFHVRQAFEDFWPIFGKYQGTKGVLHSFTDKSVHLERALKYGLYIGINGIATFTQHQWQLDLLKSIPLEKIVVETDAPFLTPIPKRGTINLPENVIYITKFLAELRGEDVTTFVRQTTDNARRLFNFG
jgi:TatD DNase family protein